MPSGPKRRRAAKRKQPSAPTTISQDETCNIETEVGCNTALVNEAEEKAAGLKGFLSSNMIILDESLKDDAENIEANLNDVLVADVAGDQETVAACHVTEDDTSMENLTSMDIVTQPNQIADHAKSAMNNVVFLSDQKHQIVEGPDADVSRVLGDTVDASNHDDSSKSEYETDGNKQSMSIESVDYLRVIEDDTNDTLEKYKNLSTEESTISKENSEKLTDDVLLLGRISEEIKQILSLNQSLTFKEVAQNSDISEEKEQFGLFDNSSSFKDDTQISTDHDNLCVIEEKKQLMSLDKFSTSMEDAQNPTDNLCVIGDEKKQLMSLDKFSTSSEDAQNYTEDLLGLDDDTSEEKKPYLSLDKSTTSKKDAQIPIEYLGVTEVDTLHERMQLMSLDMFSTSKEVAHNTTDELRVTEKNQCLSLEKSLVSKQHAQKSAIDLLTMDDILEVEEQNLFLDKSDHLVTEDNTLEYPISSDPNQNAGHAKSLRQGTCGCNICRLVCTLSEFKFSREENARHYGSISMQIKLVKEMLEEELRATEKLSLVLKMTVDQLSHASMLMLDHTAA